MHCDASGMAQPINGVVLVLVAKSCLTPCDPIDYSLLGSSVHGFPRQEYWSGRELMSPINSVGTRYPLRARLCAGAQEHLEEGDAVPASASLVG